MSENLTAVIRDRLQELARRGVLRGVGETVGRGGRMTFEFGWLLHKNYRLSVHPVKRRIEMAGLLPAVANRSFLDRDLRQFIAGRADSGLPEHRRIDPDRASIQYRNHKGCGTLSLVLREGEEGYGITALLRLVGELFSYLELYHITYLNQQFDLPEE